VGDRPKWAWKHAVLFLIALLLAIAALVAAGMRDPRAAVASHWSTMTV
jgi:uncharacterized protein YpmS